jgi:hypothetical protein
MFESSNTDDDLNLLQLKPNSFILFKSKHNGACAHAVNMLILLLIYCKYNSRVCTTVDYWLVDLLLTDE